MTMSKIKICIDAGHVGSNYNQSPVVKTYFESEAMWKLHLLLKAELKKKGFEVITTRERPRRLPARHSSEGVRCVLVFTLERLRHRER